MPICTNCGENNPEHTPRCNKCGVALSLQARARADAKRSNAAGAANNVIKIAIFVAVAFSVMPAYHFLGTSYFKYRLDAVTEGANKTCSGPVTATMPAYQQDMVNQCLEKDENLIKVQTDYNNFTKTEPPAPKSHAAKKGP
jgi:hypothetical protein